MYREAKEKKENRRIPVGLIPRTIVAKIIPGVVAVVGIIAVVAGTRAVVVPIYKYKDIILRIYYLIR